MRFPLARFSFVTLVLFAIVFAFSAAARASEPDTLDAIATPSPPPVTGSFADVSDPIWTKASHVSSFTDFTDRQSPADRTDVYLTFGKDAIYCAFVLEQSSPIVADQRVNGVGLGLDDYVSLEFDTAGNGTNSYFFETTPAGVRYQAASESTRYDPVWTARAAIGDHRWIGEMIVPYRFLRSTSKNWRINFVRHYAHSRAQDTWSYASAMTSPFDPTFWNTIRNVPYARALGESATAQIYGLLSAGTDRHVFEGAAAEFDSNTIRSVGVDTKIPITSGVNFVGTLAPDFSNVETDQTTTSPQEFRYQYTEYRPFFTQGANDLPSSEVFYSPAIGVFDSGEKIEGAVGPYSVGVLNVDAFQTADRAYEVAYNASNQEFAASVAGAQAQRANGVDNVVEVNLGDVNRYSRIAYGSDVARESGSYTQDVAQAFRSDAYLGVNRPNYSANFAYFDIGPQYAPLDAYVNVNDIKGAVFNGSLATTVDPKTAVRQLSFYGYADRYVDDSGAPHESDVQETGYVSFKDRISLSLGSDVSTLRTYESAYPQYVGATTTRYDQATASAYYRRGTPDTAYVSYSFGPYGDAFLQQFNGSGSYQFTKRLSSEFDYSDVTQNVFGGPLESQTLRRLTAYAAFSANESLSVAIRNVSGVGGFALPGENLSIGFRRVYGKGSTLTLEFGSPASGRTLDRFIAKYVLLIGGGSGE